jgi:general secretion pathway protein J
MNSSSSIQGFTLLELLIALSIFSVMGVMAYGGIRLVLDGNSQLEHAAENLSALQRVFMFMQQDVEQITPRVVRDEFGSPEPAFNCCDDEKLFRLTRGGVSSALSTGSELRRVEYHLQNGVLERRVWPILDRVQDVKPSRLQLMENVQSFDINILGYDDAGWQSSMPSESTEDMLLVPRAIEITITTKGYGAVSRLFVIGS